MSKKLVLFCVLGVFYEAAAIVWLWIGNPAPWFKIWFYNLAWWPHLILIQALAKLLWNKSTLFDNPRKFGILLLGSVPFWTSYEILNVVLKNWVYVKTSLDLPYAVRWTGYTLAYASVLPAIRSYLDLLGPSPVSQGKAEPAPTASDTSLLTAGLTFGLGQLFLCMLNPTLFYPLAWSFAFFLSEPWVVEREPERSYLKEWVEGNFQRTVKTVAAGFLAGITWEFLNWEAGAKWVYTLPQDVAVLKIFEMPILGYIGFGAFALSSESFSNFLLSSKIGTRPYFPQIAWASGLLVCLVGFALIDQYTWVK